MVSGFFEFRLFPYRCRQSGRGESGSAIGTARTYALQGFAGRGIVERLERAMDRFGRTVRPK